ncbi:MAG: diguanylate cyclase [Myxococcales bacterium]|nr:diguanylate cyclase [Myxococcales bacterium]
MTGALYRLRQTTAQHWGLYAAGLAAALLATGALAGRAIAGGPLLLTTTLALVAGALAYAVARELPSRKPDAAPRPLARERLHELELGLLLLVAAYALIHLTGGVRSFLYPLVYALASFLAILHRFRGNAILWFAAAVGLELLTGFVSAPGRASAIVTYHVVFLGFFAAGNALVLSSLVRRLRGDHAARVRGELLRMRREARDFRLLASQRPSASSSHGRALSRDREDVETQMAQGAVEGIHEQLRFTVELLRAALDLHGCAALWTDGDASPTLSIKAIACDDPEALAVGEALKTPGLLATTLRESRALRLSALGKRRPPYYRGPARVHELCAVPIIDAGGRTCGILCADRSQPRPFDDADEARLTAAAAHLVRVISQERAFTAIERDKYEQEQFYRASEQLGQALTLEDVYARTFAAIEAIADHDLAAFTAYDDRARTHEVLAVHAPAHAGEREAWRELARRLEGLQFADGPCLVSMALKNRHSMPAANGPFEPETVVFTPRTRLSRARSLLVLPLVRGEQALGAITLASEKPDRYPAATREMLRVISHQVAVSLQNARMYASMEARATTDGLTGLTNHRAFQERLATLHALAERSRQRFSLILTDIDHFKQVNDTHGHPVGDAVLKRVAAVLRGRSRKVDIVARYGGEEFVLVLPDTDAAGAELFANELREEVAAQTMTGDAGPFKVTISMGIASYPDDAEDRRELIERADQALYHCKRNGRNCVIRHDRMPRR